MIFNAEVASIEMAELAYKYLPQQQSKQDNKPKRELEKFAQKDKIKIKKSNKGNEMFF